MPGVCECAWSEWLADRADRGKLLTAVLELWLVITWYVPDYDEFRGFDLNLNLSRLQQAAEAGLDRFRDDPEAMALLGWCMSVQPFWFIGTSAGKAPDPVAAAGRELLRKARTEMPTDPVIAALNRDPADAAKVRETLQSWDSGWIRDYFGSVLPVGRANETCATEERP